jgi:hypothetical protein
MECEKCKSTKVEVLSGTTGIQAKKPGAMNPHLGSLLFTAGLKLGEVAVKGLFSKIYRCQQCAHTWRKWGL